MMKEFKTVQDLEIIPTLIPTDKGSYPCNDEIVEAKSLIVTKELRDMVIKLIKLIRSMTYGQRLCLNCMKIYGGGNSGQQYCCEDEDGKLHFLEQQTGSSMGAVEILMKINNITEEDLK